MTHEDILLEALEEALTDFAGLYLHFHSNDYICPDTEMEFDEDVAEYAEKARDRYIARAAMRLQRKGECDVTVN